jgi:hypothetical protein
LPGSALKVPVGGGGGVASYPLSSQAPTPVEVELGCDNIYKYGPVPVSLSGLIDIHFRLKSLQHDSR